MPYFGTQNNLKWLGETLVILIPWDNTLAVMQYKNILKWNHKSHSNGDLYALKQ